MDSRKYKLTEDIEVEAGDILRCTRHATGFVYILVVSVSMVDQNNYYLTEIEGDPNREVLQSMLATEENLHVEQFSIEKLGNISEPLRNLAKGLI